MTRGLVQVNEVTMMDKNKMESHVDILGWLYIVLNGLMGLGGLFLFMLLGGIGLLTGDPDAVVVLPIVGFVLAFIMIILALPGVIGGIGLLKRQGWARIVTLILGCLNLVNFPLGTLLGAYTLWALLQEGSEAVFKG